ncbi:MAG TPA: PKD domain-containing protein, partial [Candidatus Thermoplasmatota archaeon]|nr:PKD domain-containing protein [Candidatus Thermoplasmatota archaeon]
MKHPKAMLVVGALLIVGLALAWSLPTTSIPGLLDLTSERIPAPPELRVLSPADGDGVGANVTLAGQALSNARDVADVHYRVDGGRWQSAPLAAHGQRSTPFAIGVPLGPGDHVLEVRAFDGDALSIPARLEVRRDAPTLRILTPADGDGLPEGTLALGGTIQGRADAVLIELDGQEAARVPIDEGTWSAAIDVPAGPHALTATALGAVRSLPRVLHVAAGSPAPPTVRVLSPHPDASYGEEGDLACGGACILATGTASDAVRIAVQLDGLAAQDADLLPTGTWTTRLPMVALANGTHVLRFVPLSVGGQPGVAATVRFLTHTPLQLAIAGTDAPQPTGTPLAFSGVGADAERATWTLDGAIVAEGAEASLVLERPGDHVLSLQTSSPRGRSASASIPLHALDRLPTVAFVGEPQLGDGGHLFKVDASDEDGRVVEYRWGFGDGTTLVTTKPEARHRYAERGSFLANVTATDDVGGATTVETNLQVENGAPLARFEWTPTDPTILDVVTLHDTSLDHDGLLIERTWSFDDGTTSGEAAPQLRFDTRGTHNITLRVVDDAGDATQTRLPIPVHDIAPTASFRHEPALPVSYEEVLFLDASTDADGPLANWTWRFGDNTTAHGPAALHAYRAPGNYTVDLHVIDDAGAAADHTQNITILDSAPAIHNVTIDPPEPRAQQPTRFDVIADDREGNIVAATWQFGDGTTSNETSPTHRYPRSGTYQGNVTVYDEAGLALTLPYHILVHNAPPTATIDIAPGGLVAAYPTTLLANATDPDGHLAYYRFDADGDGHDDCQTTEPHCTYVYEHAGVHTARLLVEDDEAGYAETERILDIGLPPADHPPPTVAVENPTRTSTLRGDFLIRGAAHGPRTITKIDLQLR